MVLAGLADGLEKKGMAAARVKEFDAQVLEKAGKCEATAMRERGMAEAEVIRQRHLAWPN